MERVLKAVPADLRVKMEALVHDLTLALEESSNSANLRRRWGIRRRARSTGNIRKCKGEQFDVTSGLFFSDELHDCDPIHFHNAQNFHSIICPQICLLFSY